VKVARTAFVANWLLATRRLENVRHAVAPQRGAATLGGAKFLTTVVRLPPSISEPLAETASSLVAVQPGHHLYPPASIHLTVLGLADKPGVADAVAQILGRHRPFEVEVGGLNVSLHTVFAELYPRGPGLRALRGDLRAAESTEHGAASRWLRHRLAHANLVRFAAPVDPRLIARVASLRRHRFGTFEVVEVELVRADKVLSAVGTRTLGRFRLGG
jgi:2'-5' RNA ligase